MGSLQRPDVRVVVRILGVLAEREPRMRRTPLQQAARTNYTQFRRYLEALAARGLVRLETDANADQWVVLTPRGHEAYRFLAQGTQGLLAGH